MTGLERIPAPDRIVVRSDSRTTLYYHTIDSTQEVARALAGAWGSSACRYLVRAGFQRAGRGQAGRNWHAEPESCLLATWPVAGGKLAPGILALGLGVALARAVRLETGLETGLKWPNDLIIRNRKAGGILCESAPGAGIFLAGFGVNGNVDNFPDELEATATSLSRECDRTVDLDALESRLSEAMDSFAREAAAAPESVLAQWNELDRTTGRRYQADAAGRTVIGDAVGLSPEGALRIATPNGVIEVYSATSLREDRSSGS